MKQLSVSKLRQLAAAQGLELLGVLPVDTAEQALREKLPVLEDWQAQGAAAEMNYMCRPSTLFADLKNLLPEIRSVASFSVSYYSAVNHQDPAPRGYGKIARYAWGRDYHRVFKRRLKRLIASIEADLEFPIISRAFTDAVPLLERSLAAEAGLGFRGKNTMLITPGRGSFTFIGEILWNLDLSFAPERNLGRGSCGTCRRCQVACPTQAFTAEYFLDARRCISYLTIEKKGPLAAWEQQALGDWLFGCDICQNVCPFNHENIEQSVIEEFQPEHGAGPLLALADVLSIRTPEAFLAKFQGTPLMRAGREGLIRNACAVAVNQRAAELSSLLEEVQVVDASPQVRNYAGAALRGLS